MMLIGKYFPQNLRAFRLLLEELLRHILPCVTSYEDLTDYMFTVSAKSNTPKLWVDAFISPVLIMT